MEKYLLNILILKANIRMDVNKKENLKNNL
jgi:hypothetical protein